MLVGPAVRRFAPTPCPPTRSSSTARRTTSCRSPKCSRGRGRSSCPSSCFPAAATSSTAGCRSCSARSPGCGTGTRWPRCLTPRTRPARPGRRAPRRAATSCCASRACASPTARTRSSAACRSRSAAASASACSARTAPARPPRCAAASGSSSPTAARSRWSASRVPEAARAARIRVGVVPQQDNLDPDFTVTENLQVYGRYFGIDPRDARRRAFRRCSNSPASTKRGATRAAHALGRHEAAPDARARARQRPRAPDPRRADDRARSAGAAPHLGRPAPAPVARQDDPAHDALHGRGGAARARASR